nr:MAG: hypothetical protein DIU68_21055 [Chloroflexota bacterium]
MPVPPLALPHPARLPPVDELTHYSAISLFVDRAQAVKPDFALTPSNASAVAAICARLDGLPLAIELISARVKLLPPAALLERLHGPLLLRSDGLRDLDPRHRTLNAAIDWSYRLLNAGEQTLFRRLGIFVGGWTMEAAEAVCLQNLNLSLMDGLAALLDNNLIKQETQSDGEARFTMLETIREYALEQLAASRELELLEQRHAHYYLTFAAEVEARPKNAQRWGLEWDQLDRELPNFRAALAWFKKRGENETLLRLALSLNDLWLGRGHLTEGRTWLTDGLAGMQPAGPTALSVDDYKSLRSTALNKVGLIHQWQGNLDAALPYHEESVALCRELGDRAGLATALGFYGMLFVLREDVEQAGPLLQEALALWRALNNLHGISQITFYLGALAYVEGNLYLADQYWSESLDGMYAVGDMWVAATIAAHHAMIALDRGEYELAHARLVESLTLLQDLGEQWQIVHTLEVSACLAVFRGQESAEPHAYLLRAARIFGAAEKLRETLDAPVLSFQRRSYERGLAALRAQLEEPVLQVAWGEGRKMTLEQAVEQALVE